MLENRTIISKEENKKINKKIVLNQTMILLIFGPVLLIAGILLMIIQITQLNNIEWTNYLIIIAGIIFTLIPFVFEKISLKGKDIEDAVYEYEFFEKDLKMRLISNNKPSKKVTIPYNKLVKIELYKSFAYLYLSEYKGVVVKYDGFKKDEVETGLHILENLSKQLKKVKAKKR
jgi:hypothetical protein